MSPRIKDISGRVGGKNHAHVTATTPTLPTAHNVFHRKGCGIHPAGRISSSGGVQRGEAPLPGFVGLPAGGGGAPLSTQ